MGDLLVDARKSCTSCEAKAKAAGHEAPRLVLDHSMGDLICTGCGLVLQSYCMDESEEWRSFAPEGVTNGMHSSERARADHTTLRDFDNSNALGTGIGGASLVSQSLQKAQRYADSSASSRQAPQVQQTARTDKQLKNLVGRIREQAGRLSLGESIIRRCHAMLQDLEAKGKLPPAMQASKLNALIHLASSQEKATRTIAELAEANAKAAGKRERDFEKAIEKRVKELSRDLEIPLPTVFVEDEQLMARFVNLLELTKEICKPASHIARQAYALEFVRSKSQAPVVAVAILIVAWLLDVPRKPRFADVAVVAKVSEAQVKTAYKSMLMHVRILLPEDFRCRLPAGVAGLPPAK